MLKKPEIDFAQLYLKFNAPIVALNCGEKCSPHNEHGIPFCCDIHHAVPSAYIEEWEFLRSRTRLWSLWQGEERSDVQFLKEQTPEGQVLIACLGHTHCERENRSITCRAFPFFPYITLSEDFIGMSYYWEYEEQCWVISHLSAVVENYRTEFFSAFDHLFSRFPKDKEAFHYHSKRMRRAFGRQKRLIPILHRDGGDYLLIPHDGSMQPISLDRMAKFGPYAVAAELPFPGEGDI
jgi:hypothetical protein